MESITGGEEQGIPSLASLAGLRVTLLDSDPVQCHSPDTSRWRSKPRRGRVNP